MVRGNLKPRSPSILFIVRGKMKGGDLKKRFEDDGFYGKNALQLR